MTFNADETREKVARAIRGSYVFGDPDDILDQEDLNNMADAAIAAYEAAQWQPIDSAPKDGTRVLLRWPGAIVSAVWIGLECGWYPEFTLEPAGERTLGPAYGATHWRPLPPPPT